MNITGLCPLFSHDDGVNVVHSKCKAEGCAWWDEKDKQCRGLIDNVLINNMIGRVSKIEESLDYLQSIQKHTRELLELIERNTRSK